MRKKFTIERLGHQGDGIATGQVYAARSLPGELVSGEIDGNRLTDIRIEKPSPQRVSPPCHHYGACGGCQLQHASDAFVADWKVDVVRSALSAQGITTAFRPIHTSPPGSRRRAALAVRRTRKGALAGFHGRASGTIAEIPGCCLLDPALIAVLPAAEALAMIGGSRKGALSVTLTLSAAGPDVAVTGGKPLGGPLELALAQACEAQGLARLAWNGEVVAMRHAPLQEFGGVRVLPPPGAFLQATRDGEDKLVSAIAEITKGARRIADLFAGCGTFGLPLAARAEVHAVEGDGAMIAALDLGWRGARGLKRVTTETRDLFRRPLLADELGRYDAVVLDPPRAGAEAQVAALAQARIPVIAYVSCNPVTFARDARTLVDAGYRLNWVQVVDQFRWSTHVELAAAFSLQASAGKSAEP